MRDLLLLVGVDLSEGDDIRARELLGELLVQRRNRLAGTTPVGINYKKSMISILQRAAERDYIQSMTTILEDDSRSLSCEGDPICTVFDIFVAI